MLGNPPGTTAILQSLLSTSKPCGLAGKSSSAAGAEWGRWVRICSRPIGVHIASPSSMDTARHVVRLPKSGWNRKTLCCSGRRKECTWLGRLAMVGLVAISTGVCYVTSSVSENDHGTSCNGVLSQRQRNIQGAWFKAVHFEPYNGTDRREQSVWWRMYSGKPGASCEHSEKTVSYTVRLTPFYCWVKAL